jgi:flavin reductase (DIM6/NTAB) family NADH-FMN oxidoreductase RutF
VSIEKGALTHELIHVGRAFTINLVNRDDRAIVRKFTRPVEVDTEAGTLNGFAYHLSRTGAPILDQAVAYLECEVRQEVDLGGHTLFVGEIVDSRFQQDEAAEILRMEDTRMSYGG